MSNIKTYEDNDSGMELGKRTYLSIVVEIECPHCGEINYRDFSTDYLSHPTVGDFEEHQNECEECLGIIDYELKLTLKLQLKQNVQKS